MPPRRSSKKIRERSFEGAISTRDPLPVETVETKSGVTRREFGGASESVFLHGGPEVAPDPARTRGKLVTALTGSRARNLGLGALGGVAAVGITRSILPPPGPVNVNLVPADGPGDPGSGGGGGSVGGLGGFLGGLLTDPLIGALENLGLAVEDAKAAALAIFLLVVGLLLFMLFRRAR